MYLKRVVEVFVGDDPGDQVPGDVGSGYLVAEGLVLTATHIVGTEQDDKPVQVRLLGEAAWTGGKVVDASDDVAVVRTPGLLLPSWCTEAPWGGIETQHTDLVPVVAVGFPRAQSAGEVRDTEQVHGTIAPGSGFKSGLWILNITSPIPRECVEMESPWAGMSGAAVFASPTLIGVVVNSPANFKTDRLQVAPANAMLAKIFNRADDILTNTVLQDRRTDNTRRLAARISFSSPSGHTLSIEADDPKIIETAALGILDRVFVTREAEG